MLRISRSETPLQKNAGSLALTISFAAVFLLFVPGGVKSGPQPDASKALQVYFIDVEGGQATLFVSPKGNSLLIDTGWPGHDGRDANRIVAAAKDAKISKIDFVLLTHFLEDHAAGFPSLRRAFLSGRCSTTERIASIAMRRRRKFGRTI